MILTMSQCTACPTFKHPLMIEDDGKEPPKDGGCSETLTILHCLVHCTHLPTVFKHRAPHSLYISIYIYTQI